jgi:integrase-like protein
MDFSEFETVRGGIWRICGVIDYPTKYCLAATVTPTSRGADALGCLRRAVTEAERLLDLDDLRIDRGQMDVVDADDFVIGEATAPIAVVTDNGPCFRGVVFADAFTGGDPLLRHVRTRVKSPQTNGVVERFFGTVKYEHLYRAIIGDGDALAVEVNCFRHTYNTLRPHQALRDLTPHHAFLAPAMTFAQRGSQSMNDHRQLPSGRARQPTHQASPTSGLPTTEEHDMSKVKADISMSLDGYIDATGVSMEEGMGRGGEVLHDWGMAMTWTSWVPVPGSAHMTWAP